MTVNIHLNAAGSKAETVTLANGEKISCGILVNTTGPRRPVRQPCQCSLPVKPRKRFTWIFSAETPWTDPALTIDASGIHLRQYGRDDYMAARRRSGCRRPV